MLRGCRWLQVIYGGDLLYDLDLPSSLLPAMPQLRRSTPGTDLNLYLILKGAPLPGPPPAVLQVLPADSSGGGLQGGGAGRNRGDSMGEGASLRAGGSDCVG